MNASDKAIFNENLNSEFQEFVKKNLEYVSRNIDNYRRVSFDQVLQKKGVVKIEEGRILQFISKSADCEPKVEVGQKREDGSTWWTNEILFSFINEIPEIEEWDGKDFWDYRNSRNELEFQCQQEFFDKSINEVHWEAISKIEIFDDKVIKKKDASKYLIQNKLSINKGNWLELIETILKIKFPEFAFQSSFSSQNLRRYLTPLSERKMFGFEFNLSDLNSDLSHGDLTLPKYFNVILIDHQSNKDFQSFGILGNPYFYPPCYPLNGFSAILRKREVPGHSRFKLDAKDIDETYTQLRHPAIYGELMKKHALFYMDLLSETSKIYLEYLKSGIIKTFL